MTKEEYINWKNIKGYQAFVDAVIDAIIFKKRFAYITQNHYNRFDYLKKKYNVKNINIAYPFIEQEAILIYNKRYN
jgi:hypothetical protein